MSDGLGPHGVFPFLGTLALFLLVSFGIDAVASTTWADLGGLVFLMASPAVFRGLKRLVPSELRWADLGLRPERVPEVV